MHDLFNVHFILHIGRDHEKVYHFQHKCTQSQCVCVCVGFFLFIIIIIFEHKDPRAQMTNFYTREVQRFSEIEKILVFHLSEQVTFVYAFCTINDNKNTHNTTENRN